MAIRCLKAGRTSWSIAPLRKITTRPETGKMSPHHDDDSRAAAAGGDGVVVVVVVAWSSWSSSLAAAAVPSPWSRWSWWSSPLLLWGLSADRFILRPTSSAEEGSLWWILSSPPSVSCQSFSVKYTIIVTLYVHTVTQLYEHTRGGKCFSVFLFFCWPAL